MRGHNNKMLTVRIFGCSFCKHLLHALPPVLNHCHYHARDGARALHNQVPAGRSVWHVPWHTCTFTGCKAIGRRCQLTKPARLPLLSAAQKPKASARHPRCAQRATLYVALDMAQMSPAQPQPYSLPSSKLELSKNVPCNNATPINPKKTRSRTFGLFLKCHSQIW